MTREKNRVQQQTEADEGRTFRITRQDLLSLQWGGVRLKHGGLAKVNQWTGKVEYTFPPDVLDTQQQEAKAAGRKMIESLVIHGPHSNLTTVGDGRRKRLSKVRSDVSRVSKPGRKPCRAWIIRLNFLWKKHDNGTPIDLWIDSLVSEFNKDVRITKNQPRWPKATPENAKKYRRKTPR